jgi:hypothetical protein
MRRELIAVAYDEAGEEAAPSAATKQLVVLAADQLSSEVLPTESDPEPTADQLVERGILPACYRPRYNRRFLDAFHNTLELTRNSLVGDLPVASSTLGELAAHAILRRARQILTERGQGCREQAGVVDPTLPDLLEACPPQLAEGLDYLVAAVIEDADVLYLFDVPAGQEPEDYLSLPGATSDVSLLFFENWLRPFGNAPRPHVTYDGRAWPE